MKNLRQEGQMDGDEVLKDCRFGWGARTCTSSTAKSATESGANGDRSQDIVSGKLGEWSEHKSAVIS